MAIRPCCESTKGWTAAPGVRHRRNQSSYELNEHGPALNVFWSRNSGMGAGCGVIGLAALSRQVKAIQAPKKKGSDALDESWRKGYSGGAYKTSRRGVANCARPFGSKVDELLSPAAVR
jgi:hypothetical protein